MEKILEEFNNLQTITNTSGFDVLDTPIDIVEDETKKIVYTNKAFDNAFNNGKKVELNISCQHFFGKNSCPNCAKMRENIPETFISNFYRSYNGGKYYHKVSFFIYKNQLCRLEQYIDINNELDNCILINKLINKEKYEQKILDCIYNGKEKKQIIQEIESLSCDCLKCDEVHFYDLSEDISNRVINYNRKPKASREDKILDSLFNIVQKNELFDENDFLFVSKDTLESDLGFYNSQELKKWGVNSFALVRISTDKEHLGFLSLINFASKLDYSDRSFILQTKRLIADYLRIYYRERFLDYDKRTGLMNSNKFIFEAEKFIERIEPEKIKNYSILKIDIAKFKVVNSYYGSSFGDKLIEDVAKTLMRCKSIVIAARVENSDIFYGLFEESAILLKDDVIAFTRELAKQNFNKILDFTAGIYNLSDSKEPIQQMISKTSLAHKIAKTEEGMNRFLIYTDSLEENVVSNQKRVERFYNALNNDEFEIYIQPKYDTYNQKFYGGEVLSRLVQDGKVVLPGNYIEFLEKNGLVNLLDRYMFKKTMMMIRKWLDEGRTVYPLSINISRASFLTPNLEDSVLQIIDDYAIPHDLIQVEITESAYVENEELIKLFADKMIQNGVKILMDDFGTGYSSLNTLKDLNISELKLDYRFLSKTKNEYKKIKIIQCVIGLARDLNIPVVVEGVEEQTDADLLIQMGVRYIQ